MNQDWKEFICQQGANIDEERLISFGEANNYSLDENYLCDLSSRGIIQAFGEDAKNFLHGQFTNDLNALSNENSQLSSYCNPKGRMLAIFTIYLNKNKYSLIMPRSVVEATLKKLIMFKLMTKVEIQDMSDGLVIFGVAGSKIETALHNLNISIPKNDNDAVHTEGISLIRIPGQTPRILFVALPKLAISIWNQLSAHCNLASSNVWDLHDIDSGIPKITAETYEAFIPQMVNLEIINGVNFQKGCYPGQEVVARTHYLGKPNRRMYKTTVDTIDPPSPGENIFSETDGDQPVGKIVTAQINDKNVTSALAVLRTQKENDSGLHVGTQDGPTLSFQTLPYSLEAEQK